MGTKICDCLWVRKFFRNWWPVELPRDLVWLRLNVWTYFDGFFGTFSSTKGYAFMLVIVVVDTYA